MKTKMIELNATYFKASGKWYMDEQMCLVVPIEINTYDLRLLVEKYRPYKDEFIMVINDNKANDLIGFPMIDFIK